MLTKQLTEYIIYYAEREEGPFYLYDMALIKKQCQRFNELQYRPKAIHFASMANHHPEFLSLVKDLGIHIFVNSSKHLDLALELGFCEKEIVFTASAMTTSLMKKVFDSGALLNLDSPGQLSLWEQICPGFGVGIRVNLGDRINAYSNHAGAFIGSESRLGFTIEEIAAIGDKNMIRGLHLYSGTDILDIDYLMECYRELVELADLFPRLEYLNFGGGFGLADNGDRSFDFEEYNKRLSALMKAACNRLGRTLTLYLEPGRIIGGEAGFFITRVTDVKSRGDSQLVGLNASISQFTRPLFYPDNARHPVSVIRNGNEIPQEGPLRTTFFGCSTYSRDLFRSGLHYPHLTSGDLVIFGHSGSYAASSCTDFLGFPKPKEYFV